MSEACQAEEYTKYIEARLATPAMPASRTLSISRSQSGVSGAASRRRGTFYITAFVMAAPPIPCHVTARNSNSLAHTLSCPR